MPFGASSTRTSSLKVNRKDSPKPLFKARVIDISPESNAYGLLGAELIVTKIYDSFEDHGGYVYCTALWEGYQVLVRGVMLEVIS